jgi:DNA-binding CsgD family transcriptional regulator
VEREWELAVLEQRLADARESNGSVVVIEAPAGKGKSRLLTIAGDMAREAGMQILGAHGNTLEREFAFGIALQLFEPLWLAADPSSREALLEGPVQAAARLLEGRLDEVVLSGFADHAYSLVHGLFWLTANLVDPPAEIGSGAPLVLLIDDAHDADRPSMRFLAYLAERITELPILMIVAVRQAEVPTDPEALSVVAKSPAATILQPQALTPAGVQTLIEAEFRSADSAFSVACAQATHGNPFLVTELLTQLRADGLPADAQTAQRLGSMAPEAVMHSVSRRLDRMSEPANALISAVAVLGGNARLRLAARVAGLDAGTAARAADELAAVHVFHPGEPLAFVHPLIRSAVAAAMSPMARGRAHRRAARVLDEEEAPAETVAAHIMLSPVERDVRAVKVLQRAARKGVAAGQAEAPLRMLERALAEDPEAEPNPELLSELGQAAAIAGRPDAPERLAQALALTADRRRRAELALAQGAALYAQARFREAATVVSKGLEELPDGNDDLRAELLAAFVAAGGMLPETLDEVRSKRATLLEHVPEPRTSRQRAALASSALQESALGSSRPDVRRLVDLAWDQDSPGPAAESSWPALAAALLAVDDLERAKEICDAALETGSRSPDALRERAAASQCLAWIQLHQGNVFEATADAELALDVAPAGWRSFVPSVAAALALCHVHRDHQDRAEQVLSALDGSQKLDGLERASLLEARAQLRLAQMRPKEALADALQAGHCLASRRGLCCPELLTWRSTGALAQITLGDPAEAERLIAVELEDARKLEKLRVMIRDLRVLALAREGDERIELLQEAVRLGERSPPRLEYTHALIELGASLRRDNQRAAAREPLRQALELASRGRAEAHIQTAQVELAASGARPRRVHLSGVDALTPSERRIADLAASGLTRRQIAERLFITPKTVEFHLRHVYQKLDIHNREQLAEALGEGTDA